MKKRKTLASTLIHEITSTQHRIVNIKPDGTNDAGTWVGLHEIADLNNKHLAIVGESKLPQGIFTCTEHNHQVLS